MKLTRILNGQSFTVWAIDLSDDPAVEDCPAKSFIESLPLPSRKSMVNVLELHAEHGPIQNEQRSRLLTDGIFEFKNRQGGRLLYFYLPSGWTVLTHGFHKGAKVKTEIERARRLRNLSQGIGGTQ